ncbi:aminoacyl-tRNA deacylase [Endozoicomonadaceae bacterium StTr2]
MPVRQLTDFLDENAIHYESVSHTAAYTAQEVAESAHVSGYQMAKTVIVKLDGKLAMCVIPATERVNFSKLQSVSQCHTAELATEADFTRSFPACETGFMPPFGNLYGLPVYVSPQLRGEHTIAFNAGLSTEVVKMAWDDFEQLVHPTVLI